MLNYLYQESSEFKNPKNPISASQELLLHGVSTRWKPSWHPEYMMAMNGVAGEDAMLYRVFPLLVQLYVH